MTSGVIVMPASPVGSNQCLEESIISIFIFVLLVTYWPESHGTFYCFQGNMQTGSDLTTFIIQNLRECTEAKQYFLTIQTGVIHKQLEQYNICFQIMQSNTYHAPYFRCLFPPPKFLKVYKLRHKGISLNIQC